MPDLLVHVSRFARDSDAYQLTTAMATIPAVEKFHHQTETAALQRLQNSADDQSGFHRVVFIRLSQ
jgi:hypothetical protein